MTRLSDLRRRLARLRARRMRLRRVTGYSALLLAVLWVAAAAFAVDVAFEMDRVQRLIALAACVGMIVWAFRRFTRPWLGQRESDLEMALLVERQEHIDSDLIAAIQFESPEARTWGSPKLEQAVVESVAGRTPRINVMRGLSRKPRNQRMVLLFLTAALWGGCSYLFPDHVTAFLHRALLGARHYPSRTQIESITVAGREVDPLYPSRTKIRCLFGQPVDIVVALGGELPGKGRVELRPIRNGRRAAVAMDPAADRPGFYVGQFERLVEPVEYQLFFGDAWTDPARIDVAELPVVDVTLEVTPPAYAVAGGKPQAFPSSLRQLSVIEGSNVVMRVRTDKSLKGSTVQIDEKEYPLQRDAAAKADAWADHWVLDGPDSPLNMVTTATRYAVQVTDGDDQQLERPIEGVIRIQADAAPRIAGGVVTRHVLPAARPRVYFKAVDDFGLARITLECEAVGASGEPEHRQVIVFQREERQPAPPLVEPQQGYPLDLAPFDLEKGDTLTVTLRAVDYRGQLPGKEGLGSPPIVFQVTDEQGILASMMEADRQSAQQLKAMIQRQLGIGESP